VKGATTKDFQLLELGSIVGTLVDEKSGAPIIGAVVVASEFRTNGGLEDFVSGKAPRTDSSGRFEILQAKAGTGQIVFMDGDKLTGAPGHMYEIVKATLASGQRLDLGTIKGTAKPTTPN
jgi:hypothetical protein